MLNLPRLFTFSATIQVSKRFSNSKEKKDIAIKKFRTNFRYCLPLIVLEQLISRHFFFLLTLYLDLLSCANPFLIF